MLRVRLFEYTSVHSSPIRIDASSARGVGRNKDLADFSVLEIGDSNALDESLDFYVYIYIGVSCS